VIFGAAVRRFNAAFFGGEVAHPFFSMTSQKEKTRKAAMNRRTPKRASLNLGLAALLGM
jgi:hypothetical protein